MASNETTTARDRAIGALVGLAAGDAVGTTVEFEPPGSFDPLTDMVGGGPFRLERGRWTDDTSMAMCLGESILDTGDLDPADQLRRYVAWWQHGYWSSTDRCFDIGNTTIAALRRFASSGEVTDRHVDQDSAANGSLMRLAPVPIRWHADIEEAAERAAASSRTTHPAARPVDACRVYAAMTAALIQGQPLEEVLDPDFWQFGRLDVPGLQVGDSRLIGGRPPMAECRRRWL
jgi:ADP-ribosyl-[dinitrogen reductase] hydrolase